MLSKPTVLVRDLIKTFSVNRSGSKPGLNRFRKYTSIEALKGVSFVTYSGESIGILGRNGSGKSTLLNLISGKETPTSGRILVSSRPTLLSVAAALQGNLSGLDNVRLGLLAKGLTPVEVAGIQDSVMEWADIGPAANRPLSTYSSGMKARLKFAISTAVRSEILLVDEALATGDAAFAEKAKDRMDDFLQEQGTVFIVSHSAATVSRHCSRAIWLHQGELINDGAVDDVAQQYREWSQLVVAGDNEEADNYIELAKNKYIPPILMLDSEAAASWDNSM